ncbi:HNH endonuclease [Arcobacter sp. YIC-464]|uniref:HNH endonuclease n=1 Tax=Arcobacter sp. YIC-464 TaxID=3376631 RepID=UPI003C20D987
MEDTIVKAAIKALRLLNRPSSIEDIRKVIDDNRLYLFGAQEENIDSVVRNNIERCSENTNRKNTQKTKYFKRTNPNTYELLEWENEVNFYWVNIGRSYKEVLDNSFLWAPAYTYLKDGQTKTVNAGWKHVPEVRKGDVIFCQHKKNICFIAVAKENAYPSQRPASRKFEKWKNEGYKIDVDLTILDTPIDRSLFIDDIKNIFNDKCSPKLVADSGTISQQYLISIPNGAAALILNHTTEKSIEIQENIRTNKSRKKPTERQRKAIVKARVGQGIFREEVLELWNNTCPITKINKKELLIASHIVSWQLSNDEEKLDKYNGFPFSPDVDKLFDKGYISFSDEGKLLVSKFIDSNVIQKLGIDINSKIVGLKEEHKKYLERHRKEFNFVKVAHD